VKAENSNFNVALDWLMERHSDPHYAEIYARMVKALARLWIIHGWMREIIQRLELVRPTLSSLPLELQAGLLNEIGNAVQTSGDFTTVEAYHREALKIARDIDNQSLIAHSLHFLAYAAGWQGHYEESKVLFQECLPLYRQLPEVTPIQLTRLLNNLAIVHKRLGEFDEAIELLQETLELKRKLDDELGLPSSLANLGNLLILQGELETAGNLIYEALERRRKLQDRQGMLYSVSQMAALAVSLGQYGRAATLYGAADALHEEMALSRPADSEEDKQLKMETIRQKMPPGEIEERLEAGKGWSLEEVCEFALSR
jgi:tetratricopeptide (TPR) repeat protein